MTNMSYVNVICNQQDGETVLMAVLLWSLQGRCLYVAATVAAAMKISIQAHNVH